MTTLSKSGRTARGFIALRKRYVQRAETLVDDRAFREGIIEFRKRWNAAHPDFRILTADGDALNPAAAMPPSLVRAVEAASAARARQTTSASPSYVPWGPVEQVATDWMVNVHGVALLSFPPKDFPNPYQWVLHPAMLFVATCLHTRDQGDLTPLVSDCSNLFREFTLLPEPMRPQPWGGLIGTLVQPDPDAITWYIPLYPGITANDIKEAARPIADAAKQLFRGHTTDDRIRALREAGMTQQEIEDQLGLKHGTVAAKTKGITRRKRSASSE